MRVTGWMSGVQKFPKVSRALTCCLLEYDPDLTAKPSMSVEDFVCTASARKDQDPEHFFLHGCQQLPSLSALHVM